MAGLLYKNWRQMFGTIMVLLGTQFFFSTGTVLLALFVSKEEPSDNQAAALALTLTACAFLILFLIMITSSSGLIAIDEKHSVTYFTISTPTGHSGQIRSKYYFILAEYLVFLFFAFITDTIVCVIVDSTAVSSVMMYMLIFSVILILTSVEIPFLVRFGSSHGPQVKGIAFAVIFLIAAIYFLFGDISIFDEPDILAALQEKLTTAASLGIIAVICGGAIPIYYLSYRISVKLYRKGAECYEN